MIGIPAGMGTGAIDITAWDFVFWYTLGTAIAWILTLGLIPKLTRQNIVLSSRGS